MKKLNKTLLSVVVLVIATFFMSQNVQAITVSQQFINENRSYQYLQPQGIVIHDTSDPGATAQNEHDYFNSYLVWANAHFFTDWYGAIQFVPTNERGWHAGPTANRRYLSIEMCNPKDNQEQFNIVYQNTVELAAQLCRQYGWNAKDNIFSHKYMADTYRETDHQDPYAFLNKYGKTWTGLIADIQAKIDGKATTVVQEQTKVVNVVSNKTGFTYANNAQIVNDFFYTRNSDGQVIPGRVDIGDKVTILDVSYSKQLIKLEYPTPSGVKTAWIMNVPNCIKYFYNQEYKNGSTSESVYQDSSLNSRIGSVSNYESATVLYRSNGKLNVVYSTDKGQLTKSGYVNWNDHFNKF